MSEIEEKRQPVVEVQQNVEIKIIEEHKRIRRHKQPDRDYPIAKKVNRNYGKRKSIRQRNYRKSN